MIVNTDAHDPSYVGKFDAALKLLAEEGFSENLVLNTDRDRLVKFLTE